MISLALPGSDPELCRALECRLHNTLIVESPSDADAVALIAPQFPEVQVQNLRGMYHYQRDGQHQRDGQKGTLTAESQPGLAVPLLVTPSAFADTSHWSQLLRLSADDGIQFLNPRRYAPSLQLIRRQLDAQCFGEPGLLRLHRWQSERLTTTTEWLSDLDVVLWLMGGPPDSILCIDQSNRTATNSPADQNVLTVRGTKQIHCRWSNGASALVDFCDQLPEGEGYFSMTLIGSSGAAYLDDHSNRQLVFTGGNVQTSLDDEHIPAMTNMLQQFVDSVATTCRESSGHADTGSRRSVEPTTQNDTETWHDVLTLLQLAAESAASGTVISWRTE